MQTLDFNKFVEERINKESPQYLYFNAVLSAYTPAIKDYGWLAGGAIRRLISGQNLDSDFDFFFKSKEKFDEFYVGIKGDKNLLIKKETKTDTNIKIELDILGEAGILYKNVIYQLINISYYENAEALINTFDYTLCQIATDGDSLYCGDLTLWDIAGKQIVVNKLTYPVPSMRRLLKYTAQGYYACNGALTKFLQEVIKEPAKVNDTKILYID